MQKLSGLLFLAHPVFIQQCYAVFVQCADLDQLVDRNKDVMSAGYETASKVWTGLEIVAQLELMGLTAAKFIQLQVIISNHISQ